MFERFEPETRPQPVELEKTERVKKEVADFLIEVICEMRNAIAQIEGETERLTHGPDRDKEAIQVCQVKKALIEEGLRLIETRGREMGVSLP